MQQAIQELQRVIESALLAHLPQSRHPGAKSLDDAIHYAMFPGGKRLRPILALMGARPTWEASTGRVTGFEILPATVLGRPRVDVTVRGLDHRVAIWPWANRSMVRRLPSRARSSG